MPYENEHHIPQELTIDFILLKSVQPFSRTLSSASGTAILKGQEGSIPNGKAMVFSTVSVLRKVATYVKLEESL